MEKIISVHIYDLKPDVKEEEFIQAVRESERRGLFKLPGLQAYHFVRGIRGVNLGKYVMIWIYESKQAWEKLWGPEQKPYSKKQYPKNWKIWEEKILARYLTGDPDKIEFTSYEEL